MCGIQENDCTHGDTHYIKILNNEPQDGKTSLHAVTLSSIQKHNKIFETPKKLS